MSRQQLEQHQVWLYLFCIGLGLCAGHFWPSLVSGLEALLWPLLALLLYATFTQMPLGRLRSSLRNKRFLAAAVAGNFVVIPILVTILIRFTPNEPAIQLGILLVLLVPCTDWFISFTHLGKGSMEDSITFSPISLLLQLLLLPIYLRLFLDGQTFSTTVAQKEMLLAFACLILLPLWLAYLTEKKILIRQPAQKEQLVQALGWLPVQLLALVVGLIAATQVNLMQQASGQLLSLIPIFLLFLLGAAILAWLMGKLFQLPAGQTRTLAFSFGTRNSFVVLPLALALPAELQLATAVIVLQSLVELLGMMVFLWLIPRVMRD